MRSKRARASRRPFGAAGIVAASHAFFAALDRDDARGVADMIAPGFVMISAHRTFDRAALAKLVTSRAARRLPVRTRTWNTSRAFVAAGSAVFVGKAVEHIPARTGSCYDRAGSHTVVWVRDRATWKIASYQWQRAGLDGERDYWNEVYLVGGSNEQPNRLLAEAVHGRKPGKALDLMMGQGRNSLYLATRGWDVTGVDIADAGIRIANEMAAEQQLRLTTIEADVASWDLGKEKWDLVAMIYASSSAELVKRAKASLKPGGLFVLEYFHADATANMGVGGWRTGELADLFANGFAILRDDVAEDVVDFSMTELELVRFVAEKRARRKSR